MNPYTLLFLEDRKIDRQSFIQTLQQYPLKWAYTIAESFLEAQAILAHHTFDALILGHFQDGTVIDVLNLNLKIPILMVVANQDAAKAVEFLEAGVWDCVIKDSKKTYPKILLFKLEKAIQTAQDKRQVKTLKESLKYRDLELANLNQKFRNLVEATSDLVWEIDAGHFYTYVSPKARDLLGWEPEELMGKNLLDLMPPPEFRRLTPIIQAIFTARQSFNFLEHQTLCKDGSCVILETNGVPIFDSQENFHGYRGISRDITQHKQVEVRLRTSQERYALAVSASNVGVWDWNLETNEIYVDSPLKAMFGYSDYDMGNSPDEWYALVHPEDREQVVAAIKAHLNGETLDCRMEYRMLHKSGAVYWVFSCGSAILNAENKPYRMAGAITDITERKLIEIALQESENRFQLVARATNDAIWDWNTATNHVWWGPGFQTLFGYAIDEVEATLEFWYRNIWPDDRPRVMEIVNQAISEGKCYFSSEYRFCRADGSWAHVLDRGYIMRQGHEQGLRIIGAIMDISDRKNAEAALEKARNELEIRVEQRTTELATANTVLKIEVAKRKKAEKDLRQLNAELEQRVKERTVQLEIANQELEAFSYSVSHDLRSPLRSIDGFSQALIEDYFEVLDECGKDYLKRVRMAAQRMGELIDDLLELSRLSRGEMIQERVNLSAMAAEIMATLQASQPQRCVKFAMASEVVVQGDGRLLRCALENLLGNAWKYTSKHATACIEFGTIPAENQEEKLFNSPVYFVRDDGAGFDMAYAGKLFGVFQRLHTVTEFEGTGVGLATVQRIIHRHGGQVWAESAVEQGATFFFTLGNPKAQ